MDLASNVTSKQRILVVDDEPEIRDLLYVLLAGQGYRVDLAASGLEALACLRESTYDLVTLDFHMPQMDGLELHRNFSRLYGFGRRLPPVLPQLLPPILVLTAYAQEELAEAWLSGEQVMAVLPKPLEIAQFLTAVHDLLDDTRTRSERRAQALARLNDHLIHPVSRNPRLSG